jgi:hypothetical protein
MPPREPSHSDPQRGARQPFPRRMMSIDGSGSGPIRRPTPLQPPLPVWQQQPAPQAPTPAWQPPLAPLAAVQQPQPRTPQPPIDPIPAALPVAPAPQQPTPAPFIPQPSLQQPAAPELPEPVLETKPQRRSFAVTPKQRRKGLMIAGIVVIVAVLGGGLYALLKYQSTQNNPTTAFNEALQSSLSAQKLETQTNAGDTASQTNYDLSNTTDPLVSSTATINLEGTDFGVSGYGSAKNSYVSYTKFPSVVSPAIVTAAQNGWIQLRADGTLSVGVSGSLANLADPRYQDFGPLVFGNFPLKSRTALVSFLAAHNVYAYSASKVKKTTVDGKSVLAYPVTVNVDFLKLLTVSSATLEGFSASDVQGAVNSLSSLKGADVTIDVSTSSHKFVELSVTNGNKTTTTDYTYGTSAVIDEPETKLIWQDFAPVQVQIEQQVAAHQTGTSLDTIRKANLSQLHLYLASYFSQNGSYPTYANLDDQGWVATNLPGIDPDVFRDPLGVSAALATAPKADVYAYQPLTASGKSCDNNAAAAVSQLCSDYLLTAMLSTKIAYVVQNP